MELSLEALPLIYYYHYNFEYYNFFEYYFSLNLSYTAFGLSVITQSAPLSLKR